MANHPSIHLCYYDMKHIKIISSPQIHTKLLRTSGPGRTNHQLLIEDVALRAGHHLTSKHAKYALQIH
jgi:hypothetical protein